MPDMFTAIYLLPSRVSIWVVCDVIWNSLQPSLVHKYLNMCIIHAMISFLFYFQQRKAMDAYMYGGAKKFIRYFITAYAYTASFT